MADTLRFEDNDGTILVNALTGNLKAEQDTWGTEVAQEVDPALTGQILPLPHGWVGEGWSMIGDTGAAASAIRSTFNDYESLRRLAYLYRTDPQHSNNVWWEWTVDGETDKRSFVHSMELSMPSGGFASPMMQNKQVRVGLSLVRHPYWEDIGSTQNAADATMLRFGEDKLFLSAGGTALGRISDMTVSAMSGRAYFGIKRSNDGATLAGYKPAWILDGNGNALTDTASQADTAGLNGATVMRCNFSTDATLVNRAEIALEDVSSADFLDMKGRYLILLRWRGTVASDEFHIRITQRFDAPTEQIIIGETFVTSDGANYAIAELGNANIPLDMTRETISAESCEKTHFTIYAARLSGTGDLRLDAVGFLPLEHHAICDNATGELRVKTSPNEQYSSVSFTGGTDDPLQVSPVSAVNWGVPQEGGDLVTFSAVTASTTVNMNINWIRRFGAFNG